MESNSVFSKTILSLVEKNNASLEEAISHINGKKKDKYLQERLEMAVAVLLVEVATCDQSFDMEEYNTIAIGLQRLFNTPRHKIKHLINQVQLQLQSFKGASSYAQLLKEELSLEEKEEVLSVIDQIILADGKVDDYEVFLRKKFIDMLGIEGQE